MMSTLLLLLKENNLKEKKKKEFKKRRGLASVKYVTHTSQHLKPDLLHTHTPLSFSLSLSYFKSNPYMVILYAFLYQKCPFVGNAY